MYISMYYWGMFEKPLLSHRSNNITYSECVSVALVIQQAKHTRRYYIVICGLSDPTIFFHII